MLAWLTWCAPLACVRADEEGLFVPKGEDATQWMQGCGPMANHDPANQNAFLSFVPLGRGIALQLLPRVPTLRAHRPIRAGEEILFNYGSSLPFFKRPETVSDDEDDAAAEADSSAAAAAHGASASAELADLALDSKAYTEYEWGLQGVDPSKLKVALVAFQEAAGVKANYDAQVGARLGSATTRAGPRTALTDLPRAPPRPLTRGSSPFDNELALPS